MQKKYLAIETSCDDTSVAIVDATGWVYGMDSASQDAEHESYGGIVPEIAFRNHSIHLLPMIDRLMHQEKLKPADLSGIVVTSRPGLIGSLIVGIVTAKSLSQSWQLPYLGVDHLEGHLWAPFLKDKSYVPPFDLKGPYVGLAISGGHTSLYLIRGLGDYEVLGATRDDAAGEAFDKFAKMVHLGFPGGKLVDEKSVAGDPKKFDFPRAMISEEHLDMSFSGLKSAAHRLVDGLGEDQVEKELSNLCASFQEAVVDVLISKMWQALKKYNLKQAIVTGGVSANRRLRARVEELSQQHGVKVLMPPLRFCTDNAGMIGYVGALRMEKLHEMDRV